MSTNYYVKTGKKKKVFCNYGCEHEIDEELHVGLYSLGWKFALQILPENNIYEIEDWKPILKNGEIRDEYGNIVSYEKMIDLILNNKNTSYVEQGNHPYIDAYCTYDERDNNYYCNKDKIGKESINYVLVEGWFS